MNGRKAKAIRKRIKEIITDDVPAVAYEAVEHTVSGFDASGKPATEVRRQCVLGPSQRKYYQDTKKQFIQMSRSGLTAKQLIASQV